MLNKLREQGKASISVNTELEISDMILLMLKLDVYMPKANAFLAARGFPEAVGKLTHFRLNNGNVEIHVAEMGSNGCEAKPSDESFVAEMDAEYSSIATLIGSIKEKATQSFNNEINAIFI
jgi:hypothetical protein